METKSDEVKRHVRQRGISASNLMMRANRMTAEITRDVEFHMYNGVTWDEQKPKWGQKKWKTKEECESDVVKMDAVKARIIEAANKGDKKMRLDISFDDLYAEMEKLALEFEAIADSL